MTYSLLKFGQRLSLILSADAETIECPRTRGGAPGSSSAGLLRDSGMELTAEVAPVATRGDGGRIFIQSLGAFHLPATKGERDLNRSIVLQFRG